MGSSFASFYGSNPLVGAKNTKQVYCVFCLGSWMPWNKAAGQCTPIDGAFRSDEAIMSVESIEVTG